MIRIAFLAIVLLFAANPVFAETDPLKEFHAFSVERAKLAVKLREVVAFERFYQQKKDKLAPEFKRLEEDKAKIMEKGTKVQAVCQPQKFRGRVPAAAAAAKCEASRSEYDAMVAQYGQNYKFAHGELADLGKAEKDRKVNEEETSNLLDEATQLLSTLEKRVPASQPKECILACNARPPLEMEQCLRGCMETPVKE